MRRIHLDFHTPTSVKRVGQDFDGKEFIRTLAEAHVDSVTAVFGLCACGKAYWDTRTDDVRHPGLAKDLVRELLEDPLFDEFFHLYRPSGVFLEMVTYPADACYCGAVRRAGLLC